MTLLPQEIDEVTLAFPARVCGTLLPDWDDIPDEFKDWNNRDHVWLKLFHDWFYCGLGADAKFYPKEGIDPEKALRHIQACMRSFEPKHEHKAAGVAYLLSLWFHKVKYKPFKSTSKK